MRNLPELIFRLSCYGMMGVVVVGHSAHFTSKRLENAQQSRSLFTIDTKRKGKRDEKMSLNQSLKTSSVIDIKTSISLNCNRQNNRFDVALRSRSIIGFLIETFSMLDPH